jgi:hypothetical protein
VHHALDALQKKFSFVVIEYYERAAHLLSERGSSPHIRLVRGMGRFAASRRFLLSIIGHRFTMAWLIAG